VPGAHAERDGGSRTPRWRRSGACLLAGGPVLLEDISLGASSRADRDAICLGEKHHQARQDIDATLEHRLSNGLVESTNTKVRLLTRMAFGSTAPEAMIALAMLNLGGYCPPLPGRQPA
jgi:hypothetical protein